jgi:SMP-30/Gluconolactonase/LRE-like region
VFRNDLLRGIGGFASAPRRGRPWNEIVAAFANGFAFLDVLTGVRQAIASIEAEKPTTRLNDGRTDRRGRFIAGGMDEAALAPISAVYPGSRPGECSGTSESFEEARADFEAAWRVFLSKRTEADFQAWRDQRDWTERKYALWDSGKRLEPPSYGPGMPCSRFMKCPCGEIFDMRGLEEMVRHVPHISAAA